MNEIESISSKIFEFRGQKVMLDRDLAEMYGVETRTLNQAVKRNADRFPEDFMFRLTDEETSEWKSQIVMSSSVKMGVKRNPYVFYRIRRSDAVKCPDISNRHSNQHGDYARLCINTKDGHCKSSITEAIGARKEF